MKLLKAFIPFAAFAAVWLTAHVLDGSRTLDATELFNASEAWLAVLAVLLLQGRAPSRLLATAAIAPLALVWSEAQRTGTWSAVAAGAQWLAFASLGHGMGELSSQEPREPLQRRTVAIPVAAAALALWSLKAQPDWAPIGTAMVFIGFALGVAAPSLAPERRRSLTLHGLVAPLSLFLALFLLTPVAQMRGRIFACGLAFGFGWLEGRKPS